MIGRKLWIGMALGAAMILAACSPAQEDAMVEKPTEVMMEKPTEAMMEKPTEAMMEKPTEAMMTEGTPPADAMMDTPAWFSAELIDASTGEAFTIADFKGKVVLVETMAQWCSNCLKQQTQVKALHELMGETPDFISVGLDVDPNESAEALKEYVAKNGFDWYYAVSTEGVSKEISDLYGAQFLNPPSTPILVIDRKGEVHVLPFGIKSAEDLREVVEELLNQGM